MSNIICDSSFWLALYARANMKYFEFHERAVELEEWFDVASTVYIPWPSMYLLINTKFLKDQYDSYFRDFKKRIYDGRFVRIDDCLYKKTAYEKVQKYTKPLEDCIVEEIYLKNDIKYFFSFTNYKYSNYYELIQ